MLTVSFNVTKTVVKRYNVASLEEAEKILSKAWNYYGEIENVYITVAKAQENANTN